MLHLLQPSMAGPRQGPKVGDKRPLNKYSLHLIISLISSPYGLSHYICVLNCGLRCHKGVSIESL